MGSTVDISSEKYAVNFDLSTVAAEATNGSVRNAVAVTANASNTAENFLIFNFILIFSICAVSPFQKMNVNNILK